jgi:hypothetical protein
MNVTQSAASIALQAMQQGPSQGLAGAIASTPKEALGLVEAVAASVPSVSANGMLGSIINTFA